MTLRPVKVIVAGCVLFALLWFLPWTWKIFLAVALCARFAIRLCKGTETQ